MTNTSTYIQEKRKGEAEKGRERQRQSRGKSGGKGNSESKGRNNNENNSKKKTKAGRVSLCGEPQCRRRSAWSVPNMPVLPQCPDIVISTVMCQVGQHVMSHRTGAAPLTSIKVSMKRAEPLIKSPNCTKVIDML